MSKKVPMLKELKNKYDEDQNSRAFGALAEAYRKSGQIKKSIQLLKKHLPDHPEYTLAYLTLAKCYREIKKEQEAFELLSPIVETNKENLILQETYGDLCIDLGFNEKAIEYFKRVLFYKPKDNVVRAKLQTVEELISPVKEVKNSTRDTLSENWKQVNLINSPQELEEKTSGGFMSYFDQKMESFDASILDNLSLDMIKETNVSDESLLTELTLSSSNSDEKESVLDINSPELSSFEPSANESGKNKKINLVPKPSSNNEQRISPPTDSAQPKKIRTDSEEIILEKVNTFLALLCSRRDAGFLRNAS